MLKRNSVAYTVYTVQIKNVPFHHTCNTVATMFLRRAISYIPLNRWTHVFFRRVGAAFGNKQECLFDEVKFGSSCVTPP